MSLTTSQAMATFVRERITALLRTPDGWGPPHAVELQLLLLVEMWHVAQGASREQVDGVTDRYSRWLGRKLPGPPVPLALRLGLTDHANDRFVAFLREFLALEQQPMGTARDEAWAPSLPASDQPGPHHLVEA